MSENVKTLFSDIAPTYDKLNRLLSFSFDKGWRKKSIELIEQDRLQNLSALDLCAGTYDFSVAFLKQFANSKVTALDFSAAMLKSGIEKLHKLNLQNRVTPVCGDALDLPFPNHSFDVAFCGFGMRNLDSVDRGLGELARVLKPGAELLILEFFPPQGFWGKLFHRTYARYVLPKVGQWISGNTGAYSYLRDSILGFMQEEEFRQTLQKNGFTVKKVRHFVFEVATCLYATRSSLDGEIK